MTAKRTTAPTTKSVSDAISDEAAAMLEQDVSSAPKLRPAGTLRPHQLAPIMRIADKLGESEKLDAQTMHAGETYELIGEMDLALEKVALNPAEWAEWACDPNNLGAIATIFTRFVADMGESQRSAK